MDAVALDFHEVALERIELLVEPRWALRHAGDVIASSVVARDRNVCYRHSYSSFVVGNVGKLLMYTVAEVRLF